MKFEYIRIYEDVDDDLSVSLFDHPELERFGFECEYWYKASLSLEDMENLKDEKFHIDLIEVLNVLGSFGFELVSTQPMTKKISIGHRSSALTRLFPTQLVHYLKRRIV